MLQNSIIRIIFLRKNPILINNYIDYEYVLKIE